METITYQAPPEKLHSEEINEIAKALSKAQSSHLLAKEEGSNPYFKSKYATLTEVWKCAREALTGNGLAVTQVISEGGTGMFLHTILMHGSGQWIKSVIRITPPKNTAQDIGAYLTYMKRYSLCAIAGIAPGEYEDDGESLMGDSRLEDELIKKLKGHLKKANLSCEPLYSYLKPVAAKRNISVAEVAKNALENKELFLDDYKKKIATTS